MEGAGQDIVDYCCIGRLDLGHHFGHTGSGHNFGHIVDFGHTADFGRILVVAVGWDMTHLDWAYSNLTYSPRRLVPLFARSCLPFLTWICSFAT